ncbi:MAG: FAD-dependent oxidoreductase, partial [Spirochaetia bacterium]
MNKDNSKIHSDVIIVGGGPAGSACARDLARAGYGVTILDKAKFPRDKLCAGWVPPSLFRRLRIEPSEYPGGLREYRALHFRIKGFPIALPTRQYAIRRYEFDHWLLQRSGAELYQQHVNKIERIDGSREGACADHTRTGRKLAEESRRSRKKIHPEACFLIDDRFSCRYLVGAGGTGCPVAAWQRNAAGVKRSRESLIVTLEAEFPYPVKNRACYLRFFDYGLTGYSWYFPKADGYLTIGIGGKQTDLSRRGESIREHWDKFVLRLNRAGLVHDSPWNSRSDAAGTESGGAKSGGEGRLPTPTGHSYYLRSSDDAAQESRVNPEGHLFLIGDAAGFATLDMGEGIEPAVHSGRLAARAIIESRPLRTEP